MIELVVEIGGKYSSRTLESKTNSISNPSVSLGAALSSSQPLPKQYEKLPFLTRMSSPWLEEQSEPPSITWHRPSGPVIGQTLGLTMVASSASFYSSNTWATRTLINTPHNKISSLLHPPRTPQEQVFHREHRHRPTMIRHHLFCHAFL